MKRKGSSTVRTRLLAIIKEEDVLNVLGVGRGSINARLYQ
jgi:hypothetical protein